MELPKNFEMSRSMKEFHVLNPPQIHRIWGGAGLALSLSKCRAVPFRPYRLSWPDKPGKPAIPGLDTPENNRLLDPRDWFK